ncbi:hypothetical protein PR048_003282 [Dryococelus australis]|uniref:Uncharacterized protein n=1 Tax=Dryococelus australis TaxID=614101 RepID=A0ABQ9IP37_9NEOP|nr:hypothetical protein PR048_003282 [Dryococelus australis]
MWHDITFDMRVFSEHSRLPCTLHCATAPSLPHFTLTGAQKAEQFMRGSNHHWSTSMPFERTALVRNRDTLLQRVPDTQANTVISAIAHEEKCSFTISVLEKNCPWMLGTTGVHTTAVLWQQIPPRVAITVLWNTASQENNYRLCNAIHRPIRNQLERDWVALGQSECRSNGEVMAEVKSTRLSANYMEGKHRSLRREQSFTLAYSRARTMAAATTQSATCRQSMVQCGSQLTFAVPTPPQLIGSARQEQPYTSIATAADSATCLSAVNLHVTDVTRMNQAAGLHKQASSAPGQTDPRAEIRGLVAEERRSWVIRDYFVFGTRNIIVHESPVTAGECVITRINAVAEILSTSPDDFDRRFGAALNTEMVRADEGGVKLMWSRAGIQERGKLDIPEKTRRP